MDKLRQKDIRQLKQQQNQLHQKYQQSLASLLHNQTLQILIQYSKKQLENIEITKIQNINDYSPVSISRLIFADELSKIKHEINKLPNKRCPLNHFLIIMLKVVKFPFQKVPYYILGLRQMFNEIKNDERQDYLDYGQIQNYMLGQVVNFTDDNQLDTEFEIRFKENRMQDFLMHDNGVKKIIYSSDLQKYLVLDEYSNCIKIYDQNMKIVARFEPNKEKHNKKHHNILTFDYDEFGSKLAISQTDNTFSIVHLGNFLSSSSEQAFRLVFLNEIVYKSKAVINKIYFLSMMNKWLCIDNSNEIWIYDVQNFKEENQNYCKRFKHPNDDYEITDVIELVGLSSIAFVIHNEIWFYNESLSNKKWKKFSHSEEIKKVIFEEERNEFFLVGKQEKFLTVFTLNKVSGDPSRMWTFQTHQLIVDFDVFSFHNSILILDNKNNLKVYNLDTSALEHQQNYDFIVKKSELKIKMVKNSKTSFMVHATYILCMELKKVAIEREMEFSFVDIFHYDSNKEEIVFSVNGQIMGLSLMHGEIRKNVAIENSNIDKHKAFYLGKNTDLFLIDQNDSLYQILSKTDSRYNQLKDYRKKVGIENVKKSFYDQEYHMVIMISSSSVYMIRNDSHNNFTFKSCVLLENSPFFIKYKYYPKTKEMLFLDSANTVYLMKSYNFQIEKIISLKIFKEWNEGEKIILDFQYEEEIKALMILTNNGEFAIFSIDNPEKALFVKIKDFLPNQLQSNTFTTFSYQKGATYQKKHYQSRVFFHNLSGMLIEFQVENMIYNTIEKNHSFEPLEKINFIKDTHQIDFIKLKQNTPLTEFNLQRSHIFNFDAKNVNFIKAHDKKIMFCQRILLEEYNLLTIGEDGHFKLWGKNRKIFFDLKLPLMVKIQWEMNELHQKRNLKMVNQAIQFLKNTSQTIRKNEQKSIPHIDLKKKLKNKSQKIKINHQNPIQIQFQNKDLEEVVLNKKQFDPQFITIDFTKKQRNFDIRRMNLTQRITQPWKKRRQFQELYQKASPVDKYVHKYQQKMPFDLQIMRNDLHMEKGFSIKRNKSKKNDESLKILPELKSYMKSKQLEDMKRKVSLNPQENQRKDDLDLSSLNQENKFESCLFVKTQRGPKKNNAFDEIDKYFWRKQQALLNKRWIPNKRGLLKNNQTLEPKSENSYFSIQNRKIDPLKEVIKIFEDHNKEALNQKKGRIINIPQISGHSRQQKRKKA